MKIRPGDIPNVPPEPEEVQNKGEPEKFPELLEKGTSPIAEGRTVRESAISSQELNSLKSAADKGELGKHFVDLIGKEFGDVLPAADLERVTSFLNEQIDEDPFIQEKLERIAGLLAKNH